MSTTKQGWARTVTPISTPLPESAALSPLDSAPKPTSTSASTGDAIIPRGMFIRGDITGCGSLLIEGRVQGTIRLDDNRVTVGRDAYVDASIVARDVLVMGRIHGNISATARAEIRAEGTVTGEVISPRIIVELGASLQSDIDTRKVASAADFKGIRTAPTRTNLDRTNLDHIPLDRIQPIPVPASLPIGVQSIRDADFERERLSAS